MVGAALKRDGIPRQAILKARRSNVIALSSAVEAEIRNVLARPKFARHFTGEDRDVVLDLITAAAVRCEPSITVTDCRDKKDNMYLELAAAVGAEVIISSDTDLLELDPWHGIRILLPRSFIDLPSA